MMESLSPTGIILEVLGDLELPLLNPINETADGFEIMLSYPKEKKLSKEILKQDLESKGLEIVDIDVFREKSERYAWAVVRLSEKTQ